MKTLNLDVNKRYSYADYLTWMDDVRRELYDGIVSLMSPSASSQHQRVSLRLERNFANFLFKQKCEIFHAPSDVRFPDKKSETTDNLIFTVLQPDIYVVCDSDKIDDRGCLGAPDLIIEILSPKNAKRDVHDKFKIYEEHGVREYWIVNPNDKNVNVFLLDENNKFKFIAIYTQEDLIPVSIFNAKLKIDLNEIFE